ncbi:MAG TPA: hypothetical protein PKC44_17380 [Agitococcus sp.]|nr:hypothetical protein [Agitococcus sp.]
MSLFGDLFDFVVDTVVDVVETAGTIVVDTVELAGTVATGAIEVAADVVETTSSIAADTLDFTGGILADAMDVTVEVASDLVDGIGSMASDSLDLTGELVAGLIGVILGNGNSNEEREQAERRYERQLSALREKSDTAIVQYKQKTQQTYNQRLASAIAKQHTQRQALLSKALTDLNQERRFVRDCIGQLKTHKDRLNSQLTICFKTHQQEILKQEIKAVNQLLSPLYGRLKQINSHCDELTISAYKP